MDARSDVVTHPSHYNYGSIETIDVIEDALTDDMAEGFCIGNVIKYVLRYRHKNGVEDLKKARWYLDRAIGLLDERSNDAWQAVADAVAGAVEDIYGTCGIDGE